MKSQLEQNLGNLPRTAASWHPSENHAILIKLGEPGYLPFPALKTKESVEAFNSRNKITVQQLQAMEIGSMFGWHVPGADPETHDKYADKLSLRGNMD